MGLDTEIKWRKPVKKWKPNLIQRLLIKLKIIKDKRYNRKKLNCYLLDEAGHLQDSNLNYGKYWKIVKEGKRYHCI